MRPDRTLSCGFSCDALWLPPSSVRPIAKGAKNGSEEKGKEEVQEEGLTFSSFVRLHKKAHVS
jgi:hypothetical protein